MTKNKNKMTTPKKPSTKIKKDTVLNTESFGELSLKHSYDKAIIETTDNLMKANVRKDNNIVELALALEPYMKANRKVTLDLSVVKKYVFNLVGYVKESKEGEYRANESFEADVARAVKLAFVTDSKKTGISINKDTRTIEGVSKKIYPVLKVQSPDGKNLQPQKNPSNQIIKCPIDKAMKSFQEVIMGQTSNKPSKKSTPKDTKVKEISIDTYYKKVKEHLLGLNSTKNPEKFKEFKGSILKDLTEIVELGALVLAKKKSCKTLENGKVETNNQILVKTAKFSQQIDWAKSCIDIKSLSEMPKAQAK